jgi:hypothetical protein
MSYNGIWIGENAAISITDKMQIIFLRLYNENQNIVSILKQADENIIGIVYGYGRNDNNLAKNSTAYCTTAFKEKSNIELIKKHEYDTLSINGEKLIYTMFDGSIFTCVLAEEITVSKEQVIHPIDKSMRIAQKLELWNIGARCFYNEQAGAVWGGIDTRKYSICYNLNADGSGIYCRFGKNGYTDKGRAMLSTICLRNNEVRMIKNNMDNLIEFKPILDAFISERCHSLKTEGGIGLYKK